MMADNTEWPHFSMVELQCRCCGQMGMDPGFMNRLEQLRVIYAKPMIITSAYRCPAYNSKISTTGKNGPHTTGMAVDILVCGYEAWELLYAAIGHGFAGYGLKQHGKHSKRFIHLDLLQPRLWTYPK